MTVIGWVQIGLSVMFWGAALANFVVLQSINLKMTTLNGTLRDWAHGLFAERGTVDKLEARLLLVEQGTPRRGN